MRNAHTNLSDYELRAVIATGAHSVVHRALDRRTGAAVAIKQVTSPHARHASRQEAALLRHLHHPALPTLYTAWEDEGGVWLIMEYIPGDDLAVQIERRAQPFPAQTVLVWVDQLLDALALLHAQTPPIVHGDIKPRNLKVDTYGQVRLLDFGAAHRAGDGASGYTLAYAAPEQLTAAAIDPRADLYALAATIYDLLTGVKPPDARQRLAALAERRSDPLLPASAWNPQLPPALDAVLRQGLALDPAQRFADANAMRAAIRASRYDITAAANLDATTLIGRAALLAEVRRTLLTPEVRWVHLAGPGGVGKSSIASAAAHEVRPHFAAGVVNVSVVGVTNADTLTAVVMRQRSHHDGGHPDAAPATLAQLVGNQVLLLLDGCDDLGDASHLLMTWVTACPRLKLLTTSRNALSISAAHTLRIPPLALPAADAEVDASTALASPAVQLFVAVAQEKDPGFQLTVDNLAEVIALCAALDGLPLALRLAASETRRRRSADILAMLRTAPADECELLAALTALVQESWDRLTPADQAWLMQLAVFEDGCTPDAAAAICWAPGEVALTPAATLTQLTRLVDYSLLQQKTGNGAPRYALLQSVRRFASRRLTTSGQEKELRQRHAHYFVAQAGVEDAHATPDAGRLAWLNVEHENLLAALTWCEGQGDAVSALHLATSLWRFWEIRGAYQPGLEWLTRCLSLTTPVPDDLRRRALAAAGSLARNLSRYTEARHCFEQALMLARKGGDLAATAQTLNSLGTVAFYQEEHTVAVRYFEAALALFEPLGNQRGAAGALNNLALLAEGQADYARAARLHTAALAAFRALGDQVNAAYSLGNLGVLAEKRGDFDQAIALYQESLHLHQATGEQWGIAATLANLGSTLDRCGEHAEAYVLLIEALQLFAELGDQAGVAQVLGTLGRNAFRRQAPAQAVRCLVQAEALEEELKTVLLATDCAERAQLWQDLHMALGLVTVANLQTSARMTPLATLLAEIVSMP